MATTSGRGFLGFSGYHWLAIAAAWAGWGFDMFDALLFNFVAPNCVPALLGLAPGSAAAHSATVFWTGLISSILLVGWAAGGVLFGWVADRIGRKRALLATVALYTVGTALCAAATNIWQLIAFRALASLGIGGEWGIGAALVAEAVPEHKRVEAGVILQTSSPLGLVMASGVNYLIAGVWFAGEPQTSWRYVFLAARAGGTRCVHQDIFTRKHSVECRGGRGATAVTARTVCTGHSRTDDQRRRSGRHRRGVLVGLQCVRSSSGQYVGQ